MSILLTGGAGFIGSHTCIEFLKRDLNVIVLDSLINSKEESLKRVEKITGKKVPFYKGDLLDKETISTVLNLYNVDTVIHFAGLKAVGESVDIPLKYYENNVFGTINLLNAMKELNIKNIIFSSSATVYGTKNNPPYDESMPIGNTTNPYGMTKVIIEQMLSDLYKSDNTWSITNLRYFNPIGADESGLLGEDPNGIPNNLLPYITQVSVGKINHLPVFGNDYKTNDGTCIRDYIHVSDLAHGHYLAYKNLKKGLNIYNLGTGSGTSVLEIIKAFEQATSVKIPFKFEPRRSGDLAYCYANVDKAKNELGFNTKYDITKMCLDAYNWQSKNPNGL